MDSPPARRRHVLALALLIAVALLRFSADLVDDRLAVDESDYTAAFARIATGADPYDVPRFLYPPPFARAGKLLVDGLGELGAVRALRLANLLGAVAIVWCGLGWTGLGWRGRAAAGALLLVLWAPFHQAMQSGNVSLVVIGATLVSARLLARWPFAAGALLGCGLALKPLATAMLAVLPAWRPVGHDPRRRRAPWLAAAAGVAVLGGMLLWGRDLLPRMLAKTTGPLPHGHTVSLWRLAHCLGLDLTPLVLLVGAAGLCAVLLLRRERTAAELTVLATTASVYASPLVWTHTLALTLPAQALAFEQAAARWRGAEETNARRRAASELLLLGALALAVQGSEALVAINNRPLLVQALFLAPPVVAPALFAVFALRSPGPSGFAPPVGQ